MADIKIYGTLKNATESGKVALASQIFDESLGKFQSEINAVTPGDATERNYYGRHIQVFANKNICYEKIIPVPGISQYNSKYIQGMAIYGEYAFLTYDTGYIRVLDLDTMNIVSSYAMPSGVQGANNHAGMANFGQAFLNPGDSFPLLYVSSYLENKCYVLRVTTSGCSLVQTISMANAWHFLVDNGGNLIVHMNDWSTYYIFDIPSIANSAVTLTTSGAKDNFSFVTPNMHTAGTFCQNGKMYILCYYTTDPGDGKFDRLSVYDYEQKKLYSELVFENTAIRTNEFEGISPGNVGEVYICFIANQLAKLTF